MPIPKKKEFLCMAAKINPVPTYPDISPTSYGNKSIILTIINATSA
jgi:hypothetical protein